MKFLLYIILFSFASINSQAQWSLSHSAEIIGGKFGGNTINNIFYLYTGLRYQSGDWNLSAALPVVVLNDDLVSIPGSGKLDAGIGDTYCYADYNIVNDTNFVGVTLEGIVKIPTSYGITNLGTGKFDFGANVYVRKLFGTVMALANIGYFYFGNSAVDNVKNPLTYGLGIGKFFDNGNYSLLLYYGAYTAVLSDYPPPRQLSLGLNIPLKGNVNLSFIGSAGLSTLSPIYAATAGVSYGI